MEYELKMFGTNNPYDKESTQKSFSKYILQPVEDKYEYQCTNLRDSTPHPALTLVRQVEL